MVTRRDFMRALATGAAGAALASAVSEPSGAAAAKPGPTGKQDLLDILKAAGKPAEVVTNPDGSSVILLPYGGRVLGMFAPNSQENFYWTNTALRSVESAKAFFASDEWQNTGGDRTWLAPEVDFFFPDFPDLGVYFQQRAMDPGDFHVVRQGGTVQLVNEFTMKASRSGNEIALRLAKSIAPAANPLRYEPILEELSEVEYAGYTLNASLEIGNDSARDDEVGLWNLVQMPHGGDMLIPTYVPAEPVVYFGDVPEDDLQAENHLVRYRMRSAGEHKIGVRAIATTGRVGYRYATGDRAALIVRNFVVNPSGEYVDVPWGDTDDLGISTQACNVNGDLGTFSELEYHIPAIGGRTKRARCDDAAQVWAFRGSSEDIDLVARSLLTLAV